MEQARTPVVFVHGLWLHADSRLRRRIQGALRALDDSLAREAVVRGGARELLAYSPAKIDTANGARGPLLITAGGNDHTVPAAISRSTLKLYRKSPAVTELKEFPDRGHSLALDSGWRDVADAVLGWLRAHSL